MDILLTTHNIGFIVSAIATTGLSVFLFLNNRTSTVTKTMAFTTLFVDIFIISHVAGVNATNSYLSRDILMFNLSLIFVGIANVHSVLAYTDEVKKNHVVLWVLYTSGILLTLFFIIFPSFFLLPSVPKLYFPNYYVPGSLNWVRLAFLYCICIPYMVYKLARYYEKTQNSIVQKQIIYYISAIILGYGFGFIPNFLVYNIAVDPLLGMSFMVFATVPMIYGAIKYELFDVRVIAKQAFLYGISVATIGAFVALFNFFNQWLLAQYPLLPWWVTPIAISIIMVMAGVIVWNKLRESDFLKYEFITTATHKFRTPLTHIKWATDNLSQKNLDEDSRLQIEYIRSADTRLVELTNTLVNASENGENAYLYSYEQKNIAILFETALDLLKNHIAQKHLQVTKEFEPGLMVVCDESRLNFVIQTILENAINYTPENGSITVSIKKDGGGKHVVCSVHDTGIGMTREELSFIFTKFYRGTPARTTDTEGMGIGLFIAKQIIARQNGKIWAESGGTGKGSTFYFSLPITK